MNVASLSSLVFAGSVAAGFLGSLTGLGGGVVVVPALTLALGVDMKYAIGASLVSVIATSSGAAAAYVREGFSNIRIGMFLEIELMANTIEDLAAVKQQMQQLIKGLDLAPLKTGYGTLLLRKKHFEHYLQGRFILEEDKIYRKSHRNKA